MKKLFFLLLSIFIFASCEQDEVINQIDNETSIEKNFIEFAYKGNTYKSTYQIEGENIKWENTEVGELYNNLQKLPELSINVLENGTIELYDDVKTLLKAKNLTESPTNSLRNTIRSHRPGNLSWYADDGYYGFYANEIFRNENTINVPYVTDVLNDEITAFKFYVQTTVKPVLVMWEHANYEGKSISFDGQRVTNTPAGSGPYWERNVEHLKFWSYGGFLGTKTWNDRVSSMKLYANDIWGDLSKVPIYRYYNGADHLFSARAPQNKVYGSTKIFDGQNYSFEYLEFQLMKYTQNSATVPIFGYYNKITKDHMLDINTGVNGSLPNYVCSEDLLGYAYVNQIPGTVPLKEYTNSKGTDYHYVVLKREEKWMRDNIPLQDVIYKRTLGYVYLGDRRE